MGWKNHLTAGILFVQIILVSILLYILVPLKGLVWVLSFIFQALLSFFFLEAAFGSKNRGAGRRLSVLRHFIVQIVLVSSWCLVGILAKTFFKEHAGWIALITCLLITCLSYLILPMKWVFGIPGKTRPEEFLLKYDLYLYAFFTVVTLHILLYAIYGVFPFGDNAYLRMDCYHQYTPFLKAFLRRLKTGESLLFTWDNGLGVNYWSHFGYYLSSPSNLLLLLLPEKYLTEGIAAGIVIKGALSACTFLFCLDKKFKGRDVYRFIFGVFYALSAFYIAYSCNIMWADSYVLFPLIMLGIENITKGKKAILYGVSLSLCILSNFYIAAIAGICIVLYFIANLIIHRGGGNVFLSVGRFLYATLTACLIAGIILLPEYLCLKNTAAGDLSFPRSWESYFGFHELIGRMLANVTTIQNNSELPNIYCSVFALLFLPLFFANKKIPLTKKITLGVLVVFLLLSFQWNVLSYVWHGFHYPNSFPGRFSFFFVFLILSMGYESFRMREELNQIAVMVSSGILFAGILVLGFFLSRDDLLNIFTTFVFSAVLVFLYSALCALDRKRHSLTVRNLLVILLLLEVTVNTLATGINSVVDRSDYLADEKMTAYTTAYLNELTPGFYRMEKTDKEYMNEASFDGYASASYFSSTIFGGVMNFYSKMGLRYSDVAYSYQGGNPLMASVLNIRYQVSGRDEHMGSTYETFPLSNGEGDTDYISRNKYPLSLGFAVPKDSEAVFDTLEDKKPFRNLNAFAKAIGADGNLFTPLSAFGKQCGQPEIVQRWSGTVIGLYTLENIFCPFTNEEEQSGQLIKLAPEEF